MEGTPLQRAERTYSAAADHFDRPALGFWDRVGTEAVQRINLTAGQSVLDLCCGMGASAVPAARAVGPTGQVLGIDIAEPLLVKARRRAEQEGLGQARFERADATNTGLPSGSFDAVVCVFGVFFVADMPAFVAEMWRMVRPGGRLAITTWGAGWLEPASTIFWDCVRVIEPTLHRAFNPWDSVTSVAAVEALFADGGATPVDAEAVSGQQELARPDDFWDMVLGSGYRATVDAMTADQQQALRLRVIDGIRADGIESVRTDVIHASAVR
jgi:ubiquinone/menaquinone biosynthesis C-methylase UbiE